MPFNNKEHLELLSTHLRNIRKRLGITQLELSKISGVSNTHISDIERGDSIPSLKTLLVLCDGLEIHISELFEHPASVLPRRLEKDTLVCSFLSWPIGNTRISQLPSSIDLTVITQDGTVREKAAYEKIKPVV